MKTARQQIRDMVKHGTVQPEVSYRALYLLDRIEAWQGDPPVSECQRVNSWKFIYFEWKTPEGTSTVWTDVHVDRYFVAAFQGMVEIYRQTVMSPEKATEIILGLIENAKTVDRLMQPLEALEPGWYDVHGETPSQKTLQTARFLLAKLLWEHSLPEPTVNAETDGEVTFEWRVWRNGVPTTVSIDVEDAWLRVKVHNVGYTLTLQDIPEIADIITKELG